MCVPSFGACRQLRAPIPWTPSERMRRCRVLLSKSTPCLFIYMRFSRTVSVTAHNFKPNSPPPPPPPSLFYFSQTNFIKKSKHLLSTCPCERVCVCVVFLGWLRCLPIHSACYCYRRCLQWQVRHTPLPAHHWQHHLTRPSGGALNTQPSLVLSHPYSSEVKLSPFVTSRGRRALQKKKKRPAWFISLIPLASGDGEYHGAQCSNWQIKSNEMSLQM